MTRYRGFFASIYSLLPQYAKKCYRKIKEILLKGRRLSSPFRATKINPNSVLINEIVSIARDFSKSFRYLEIGVEHGVTFEGIRNVRKVGVDPNPLFVNCRFPWKSKVYKLTSDVFFREKAKRKFNFIFIDGLHTFDQVYKDFLNSCLFLDRDGYILIDDSVPSDEFSALPNQEECYSLREKSSGSRDKTWHGDVFKMICLLDLEFKSVFDWATIVDAWNPKTIVRFKKELDFSKLGDFYLQDAKKTNVDNLEYSEVFKNSQVPEYFNPLKTQDLKLWLNKCL